MTTTITISAHPAYPNNSVEVTVTPSTSQAQSGVAPSVYMLAHGASSQFCVFDDAALTVRECSVMMVLPPTFEPIQNPADAATDATAS